MALVQVGEGFVVLLVARQNVPAAVYEAAEVDGANRWQGFWHITLPLIVPWMLLLLCRDLVVSVQNTFTPSFILTYGGPYYATMFLPLLIYELSFDFFDWGLASAVLVVVYAWILLLIWGARNLIRGTAAPEARMRIRLAAALSTWRGWVSPPVLLPFYWAVVASLRQPGCLRLDARVVAVRVPLGNYAELFRIVPMARYVLNSFFVVARGAADAADGGAGRFCHVAAAQLPGGSGW